MLTDRQVALGGQVAIHFAIEADVGGRLQPAFELDLVAQHRLSDDGSSFARGSLIEHEYLLAGCYRLVPERLRDRVSCLPGKGHAWSRRRSAFDPTISRTNMSPAVIAILRRSALKEGTRSSGMAASCAGRGPAGCRPRAGRGSGRCTGRRPGAGCAGWTG